MILRAISSINSTYVICLQIIKSLNLFVYRKACAILLRFGAEIDFSDGNQWTPVMWAVKSGDVETTSFLLEQGAQLNIKDIQGNSLLHVACINGHVDVAKIW